MRRHNPAVAKVRFVPKPPRPGTAIPSTSTASEMLHPDIYTMTGVGAVGSSPGKPARPQSAPTARRSDTTLRSAASTFDPQLPTSQQNSTTSVSKTTSIPVHPSSIPRPSSAKIRSASSTATTNGSAAIAPDVNLPARPASAIAGGLKGAWPQHQQNPKSASANANQRASTQQHGAPGWYGYDEDDDLFLVDDDSTDDDDSDSDLPANRAAYVGKEVPLATA